MALPEDICGVTILVEASGIGGDAVATREAQCRTDSSAKSHFLFFLRCVRNKQKGCGCVERTAEIVLFTHF
jgi:hypothetical protein